MVRQKHVNRFCMTNASLENSGNCGGMLSSRNPIGYGEALVNYRNETPSKLLQERFNLFIHRLPVQAKSIEKARRF